MTKKAMILMFEKYKNQVDKTGVLYVFHPFHVAETLDDEISVTVALLHDIARKVKLADLKHNSDLSRIDHPSDYDYKRTEKYLKCIDYLESLE